MSLGGVQVDGCERVGWLARAGNMSNMNFVLCTEMMPR